jgi:hypothetical protein
MTPRIPFAALNRSIETIAKLRNSTFHMHTVRPVTGGGVDCFHIDPTGTHDACINSFEAFDVNGNVWEVVPSTEDPRGYEVRGGAFNCASAAARFRCSYNADWTSLYAGFRCCKNAFLQSLK